MKKIILFKEKEYIEYPFVNHLTLVDTEFYIDGETIMFLSKEGEAQFLHDYQIVHNGIDIFMMIDDTVQLYQKSDEPILLGQKDCDIEINEGHFILDGTTILNEDEEKCYVNGKFHCEKNISFSYGDQILLKEQYVFVVKESDLSIYAKKDSFQCFLPILLQEENLVDSFPEYKRSPRIIKRQKNDKITISKPPAAISRKKNSLVKVVVPPLVMACGTVAMSLMMGRGLYMLIGLAATMVSLVFSITAYVSDKKELKEKREKREHVYEEYLLDIRKKLNIYKQNEIEALHYNNPTLEELEDMAKHYSSRIYERDLNDDDFLSLSIGKANERSEYQIAFDYDVLQTEKDELIEEAKQVYNEYQIINDKPISVDLKKAHLGIVGETHEIHEQIKWIISQITFFHSYHDVEIIMLYKDAFKDEFDYIKWYPHMKIVSNNLTGNIHSERVRDQVLGSLYQILKDRKLKRDENKKEMKFSPHFIIIVDDYHLITNHSIMEYLQEATTELGFSLIYTAQKRANLPENIKTVLRMEDMNTATLILNEGIEINKRLTQQRIHNVDLEQMARNLSILIHMHGVSSHIPESVTFFNMYNVTTPQELKILQRWENGQSHKSLAVPIGVRAIDDLVELNLHEKAHGPHGLVAGTTGSGKSETIQTYILSLAVNFSPYEVGFLLIDYKGGGMANLFKKLPHLLGTITNLDGAESMRALASIKAELARRQRIFNDNSVNNINNYNKLFKKGKAKEPLPHLFIISDEFAELKKEQPEFMSELVSVARIGRTLGVHLILATQKPTGVVDDQIWSNSKFKLALKVQDENDSKEIIKTSDAAFITQTGRGYLQVGNNEIYELFQSAWSGASFSKEQETIKTDKRIYKMNLLGQGELINQDLSESTSSGESMKTQLDAVVDHIQTQYETYQHQIVAKPWLPSLGENIISPLLKDTAYIDTNTIQAIDLSCCIGLVDIPEEQKQVDYKLDFKTDGNLAIFSSSGYGKSTTLGTIMLSLAIKNNPQLLNFYILDFGNSSLIPYKILPHVADYMTFDSEEKIEKFQTIVVKEIKKRKQIFAQEMVQNFDMYNQMYPEQHLKSIFIIIDNFDVVKEISMDFEDFIMKMTRDGVGLGIFTILSATRANAVRFATMNNFKNKIVQYMFDDGDVMSLIGRSPYKLSEMKGRALVKHKIISTMQVYAPVVFKDDIELITNLKETIHKIKDLYSGENVLGIPILPDIFTTRDFSNYKCESLRKNLVGLSPDTVELISLHNIQYPYIILGPSKSGKTNFIEILLNQSAGTIYIFDSNERSLYKYKERDYMNYISNDEELMLFFETLTIEIEQRQKNLELALQANQFDSPTEFYSSLQEVTIYIDDVDRFIQTSHAIPNVAVLLENAINSGILLYATVNSSKLKGFDDITKFFKNTTSGAVLGQMGTVNIFSINMRDLPTFGNAILCHNGDLRKVRIPKYLGTEMTAKFKEC